MKNKTEQTNKTLPLVLLRHGQSTYNKNNRFTGWTDADLTDEGVKQAHAAAALLKKEGLSFNEAHTSVLKRAIRTQWLVLDDMDLMWIRQTSTWRLNERCYGAVQGFDKTELSKKYGEAAVLGWRKRFSAKPPALERNDRRHPRHDPRYALLGKAEHPSSESLEDVHNRVLPYWNRQLAPSLRQGKRVLVCASHHSLRSLVMILDRLTPDEIERITIPLGIPLVYELPQNTLKPQSHKYLGNPKAVEKAINAIAGQGKLSK